MARKSKKLEEIKVIFEMDNIEEIETLETCAIFVEKINEKASMIVDKREMGYVLHSVESILLVVIFAMLANCNTFKEMYIFGCIHFEWLNNHIKFENGMPSLSTIKRVISFINPKELESLLVEAVKTFNQNNEPIFKLELFEIEDIKSADGKVANLSGRKVSKDGSISKMNAMSIYSVKNGICEATEFIEEKTNEIPTLPKLLSQINVKNNIITFDALNAQKEIIKYIYSNDGYYVAPIKGNHKTLYEDLETFFNDENYINEIKKNNYFKTIEKRNGDADIREYGFTNDISWIYESSNWAGLKSVGYVKRTYKNEQGKIVTDTRYYITNLSAELIKVIAMAIRREWEIENSLHGYLDMVFEEDKNKSFVGNTQKNLNIIRKFSLGLLKKYKEKTQLSMNSIRFMLNTDFERQIKNILTN